MVSSSYPSENTLSGSSGTCVHRLTASDLLLSFHDIVEGLAVNGVVGMTLGIRCGTIFDRIVRA